MSIDFTLAIWVVAICIAHVAGVCIGHSVGHKIGYMRGTINERNWWLAKATPQGAADHGR